MLVRIEFFGIARSRAGVPGAELCFPAAPVSLGRLVGELGDRFPQLADAGWATKSVMRHFRVNVNTDRFISEMSDPIHDGDLVLIMSADAGG